MTTTTPDTTALQEAALDYAARGWHVFPLHTIHDGRCSCGNPNCDSPAKHPRTAHGLKDATADAARIRAWWACWPDANIGVVAGASGLLVLDIDPAKGGDESLERLVSEHGPLPDTVESLTGGGGRHLFFKRPDGKLGNSSGRLGAGLDTRGDGGYVVAPPSVHVSGRQYAWEVSSDPAEVGVADAPAWLVGLLRDTAPPPASAPPSPTPPDEDGRFDRAADAVARIHMQDHSDGSRRLFAYCCRAVEHGLSDAEAVRLVRAAEHEQSFPRSYSHGEIVQRVRDAERRCVRGAALTVAADLAKRASLCTDIGNAARFALAHLWDAWWCQASGTWYLWDGRRWAPDQTLRPLALAKEIALSIYDEARQAGDDKRREALGKWANTSQRRDRLTAMLELAKPDLAVRPDQLDADPWLLNVLNGTIDLRTGELRPHRREDLITRLAPVRYDPDAKLPLWERFLHESTGGDQELIAFLARAIGYSLIGSTPEECLFFVYGPTATGKSTLMEAVKAALGDYALSADFESFLKRRQAGGPRNDIARLAGRRFVLGVEVEEGSEMAVGLLKLLTGGDTVAARFLYREAFEFTPRFTLWLAANHRPKVPDDDDAAWRRIHTIPFAHIVPPAKRDPTLKARLRDPADSGPAVLAWAVRGCLDYLQRGGLAVSEAVKEATAEYRAEMDPLKPFLDDCCILGPNLYVRRDFLRKAYEAWRKEVGARPLGPQAFTEQCRRHGFAEATKRFDRSRRIWGGVGLRHEDPDT